jgi:chromosome segregation and condensation protein ScpB
MTPLHCPKCGKPRFNRVGMVVVERLLATQEPLTTKELLQGTNVSRASWKAVSNRIRGELAASNLKLVNVAGFGPWQARYRLEKIEEA